MGRESGRAGAAVPLAGDPSPPSGPPVIKLGTNGLEPAMVSVLGPNSVTADRLLAWYDDHAPAGYRASVPVRALIEAFLSEGALEGVRGDVAFAQAVLETGWFGFGGAVQPSDNNFAGLGATDGAGHANVASFSDARTGVRAQIQHLRRYADPGATKDTLHAPLVDPRFELVAAGKAPYWNQFGNGIWATSKNDYSGRVLMLFAGMLAK